MSGKYPTILSELAKDLLSKIFRLDPEERLVAEDILAHPWLDAPTASPGEWRAQMEKRIGLFVNFYNL